MSRNAASGLQEYNHMGLLSPTEARVYSLPTDYIYFRPTPIFCLLGTYKE